MAILIEMEENNELRNFLEEGIDPLTKEIMAQHPISPQRAQHRWRSDAYLTKEGPFVIENNGGEPQGDIIVSEAIRFVEQVLGICLQREQKLRTGPRPDI